LSSTDVPVAAVRLTRRDFLTLLGTIPLVVVLPSGLVLAATLRITRSRFWTAPDHTRIVIELDGAPSVTTQPDSTGGRRIVDVRIAGAELQAGSEVLPVQDGVVDRVEIDSQADGSVRVRVVLQRASDPNVFQLPPADRGAPHRIVIDVTPRLSDAERQAQERQVESVRDSGDAVIAFDAGHGGSDPGCMANHVTEKDVALEVAQKCAKAVAKRAGMRAILTREKDYFVPLGRRQEIARKYGARVFVSIHCNSAGNASARGSEVFFLSLQGAADKAAKELVDRENAADTIGGVPPGEEKTALVDILWNLKQNEAMRRSERLGEIVLDQLGRIPGGEVRSLKQGPLAVLKSITGASVLVELGFVTNARDARMLRDAATKQAYADQLVSAVERFLS
jgi:N-acetylmuramoyl-L-alanine amidase